jgi:hypothetical protein
VWPLHRKRMKSAGAMTMGIRPRTNTVELSLRWGRRCTLASGRMRARVGSPGGLLPLVPERLSWTPPRRRRDPPDASTPATSRAPCAKICQRGVWLPAGPVARRQGAQLLVRADRGGADGWQAAALPDADSGGARSAVAKTTFGCRRFRTATARSRGLLRWMMPTYRMRIAVPAFRGKPSRWWS